MAQGAAVGLRDINKAYGSVAAVDDVSIEVGAGEFLTLLGPSGSGKTTTLMLIAGFESADSGEIYIGERCVTGTPPYGRDLGFVFQNYALFPHMTVAENLAYPLKVRGEAASTVVGRTSEMLELVMLPGMEDRYPSQLSGGQQQRVALARALIFNPPVLLMDEPLSALDKKLRSQMQLEIKQIKRNLGVTVVYVTHDQEEALTMSDRVAVMNDGKIVQVSTPEEIYDNPQDVFVADFVGETNLLRARLLSRREGTLEAETPGGFRLEVKRGADLAPGQDVFLALRPEKLWVRSARDKSGAGSGPPDCRQWAEGFIEEIVYLGEARKYRVRLAGEVLIVSQQTKSDREVFAPGEAVHLGWSPEDLKVLRAS